MNTAARLFALRKQLALDSESAIVVAVRSNVLYLTGFDGVIDSGINAACVVTDDYARFYTDNRYAEAASAAAEGTSWEVRVQRENLYVELCEDLQADGVESFMLESSVPYGRFTFLSEQFSGAVRVVDHHIEDLRHMKEPEEIERIAAAAAIADRAFEHICGTIAPGVTEAEVALELEFFMRRSGSEGMPFEPIVASGPNGARPHSIPGARQIESGDLVVLDFGARVGGYCSDMTRTVGVGRVSGEQQRLYAAVLAANEAGLTAVRAGMPCVDVDRAARDVLAAHDLGELFTHGLGHGVGLDVHELPTVGPRSTQSLRPGNVITVEPGVYVPGFAGVRIEDLVVVEQAGCRILTTAPKELTLI
ncbi:MAG: aminopeptidase P family protein [Coriobacteriia bacterium]|nr:aminopeptidase P family protein [Coriobacteriia bacterium]